MPPCHVDERKACRLSRLAERAEARPEGAWDERRRRGHAERKECVWEPHRVVGEETEPHRVVREVGERERESWKERGWFELRFSSC